MSTKANYYQVTQGVWGLKTLFVNVFMIANRKGVADGWVLIDAGLRGYSDNIIEMAESLFGAGTKPRAIILTHGHFDHTGSLEELLKHWDVPVYAHPLELPYLTGKSSYPPADPSAGGGLMTWMSWSFPTKGIDLGDKIQALDTSGYIEELPEWKTIHTPGHSPGHISLFFKLNATLIAGDAFATTKTESAFYVLAFVQKLSGPAKFLTTDWAQAAQSVRKLQELEPRTIAAGHGYTMRGKEMQDELKKLADNFEDVSIPSSGRYVQVPAQADENGTEYVPPVMPAVRYSVVAVGLLSLAFGYFAVREVQKRFL